MHADYLEIQKSLKNDPQGNLAGIYNIISFVQTHKNLNGDSVTRTLTLGAGIQPSPTPNNQKPINTPRPKTSGSTKLPQEPKQILKLQVRKDLKSAPPQKTSIYQEIKKDTSRPVQIPARSIKDVKETPRQRETFRSNAEQTMPEQNPNFLVQGNKAPKINKPQLVLSLRPKSPILGKKPQAAPKGPMKSISIEVENKIKDRIRKLIPEDKNNTKKTDLCLKHSKSRPCTPSSGGKAPVRPLTGPPMRTAERALKRSR